MWAVVVKVEEISNGTVVVYAPAAGWIRHGDNDG